MLPIATITLFKRTFWLFHLIRSDARIKILCMYNSRKCGLFATTNQRKIKYLDKTKNQTNEMQHEKSQRYKNWNGFWILWVAVRFFYWSHVSLFYSFLFFLNGLGFAFYFISVVYLLYPCCRKACIHCFNEFKR